MTKQQIIDWIAARESEYNDFLLNTPSHVMKKPLRWLY